MFQRNILYCKDILHIILHYKLRENSFHFVDENSSQLVGKQQVLDFPKTEFFFTVAQPPFMNYH